MQDLLTYKALGLK